MPLFTFKRGTHAQSLSVASVIIRVPAGRPLKLYMLDVAGMASAAAAGAELAVYRVGTVSVGALTAIPLSKVDPNGADASTISGFSAGYAPATSEPAPLSGDNGLVEALHFQPLGGRDRFLALPGGEHVFWSASAYEVMVRGVLGTPNIAIKGLISLE